MAQLTAEQESSLKRIQDHLKGLCESTEFLSRLAKENKWSATFAQTVLDEYAKFLFIAKEGGHPVSPSPIIDKAWHLHLIHSEDYWNKFCPQILQMPLHHAPHTGNKTEDAKFAGWNRDTLASYQKFFGRSEPLWTPLDGTGTRTFMRCAGFVLTGFSLGCLTGTADGSDAWPMFLFAAGGFSIPAILFFILAHSPVPATAGPGGTSSGDGTSSDSGHSGHSGHSCGSSCGGGHH